MFKNNKMNKNKHLNLMQFIEEGDCIYSDNNGERKTSIIDYENYRLLVFDDDVLQTLIAINNPKDLPFILNQAILACIPFLPELDSVCLLGTGGGAIARFFHVMAPNIEGDCIESELDIIKIAHSLFFFPNSIVQNNWSIVHTDARTHHYTRSYHLIIIDISQAHRTPQWMLDENNLLKIKGALKNQGVAVFNILFESNEVFMIQLSKIRKQFYAKTLCFQVPGLNNILIYAFKSTIDSPLKSITEEILDQQSKKWGIDFNYFYQK